MHRINYTIKLLYPTLLYELWGIKYLKNIVDNDIYKIILEYTDVKKNYLILYKHIKYNQKILLKDIMEYYYSQARYVWV